MEGTKKEMAHNSSKNQRLKIQCSHFRLRCDLAFCFFEEENSSITLRLQNRYRFRYLDEAYVDALLVCEPMQLLGCDDVLNTSMNAGFIVSFGL